MIFLATLPDIFWISTYLDEELGQGAGKADSHNVRFLLKSALVVMRY